METTTAVFYPLLKTAELRSEIRNLAVTRSTAILMAKVFFGLLIASWLSFPLCSWAQADTLTYFPSDRIQGGAPTFYETMSDYITYPAFAIRRKIVGTAIVAITISPKGQLTNVAIVNSLNSKIDQAIQEALDRTRTLWLADTLVKNDVVVFVPITFVLDENAFLQDADKPPFLVPEVGVIVGEVGTQIESDADVAQKANQFYQAEDYKAAIKHLDELIRRNPYRKNLYLMRGHAHHQLGHRDLGCSDFRKITGFLKQPLPSVTTELCNDHP